MKKLLFIACFFAVTTMVQAQSTTFKPFKVDLGFGYGFGNAKGVVVYLEPKYNVMDELAVGVRFESAILGNLEVSTDNGTNGGTVASNIDISAIGSYLITGDYYLSNKGFRPLAGLGAGVYSMGSIRQTVDANGTDVSQDVNIGTKIGLAPRIGFEAAHLRLALEYNLITGQPKDFNRNYFTAKFGVVFGGGRRK